MTVVQQDTSYYLETARALAARVAAETDRIDRQREILSELAH